MTFLFLDPRSIEKVNALLALPATGQEQDWEVELADMARIAEILALLQSTAIQGDRELETALAVLLVASVDQAISEEALQVAEAESVREFFMKSPRLRQRMRTYWYADGMRPINEEVIEDLFFHPDPR